MTIPAGLLSDVDALLEPNAPLGPRTWFGVGGCCDLLARPRDIPAAATILARCRQAGVPVRVLGSGANLLVADEGVDGVVLLLDQPTFTEWHVEAQEHTANVACGSGTDLAKLMHEMARLGWEGLETLAGIPATVGGAVWMNAGGRFGEIGRVVTSIEALDGTGRPLTMDHREIRFDYRHTRLPRCVLTRVHLRLRRGEPLMLRERLKEVMAYKKASQPLAERSAGCMFRNPVLPGGERVSAGKLIDQAGLKGTREGSASVSPEHANFICVDRDGRAADVMRLVERIRQAVRRAHGVQLQAEVAVWRRGDPEGSLP
ncbi:MAG: UDP-N-acetylenolpyruvoylglucosamine reductase MurB [Planctomycetota bacterium]|jgi:UDP-N-acetylmuramate dehydrogenase